MTTAALISSTIRAVAEFQGYRTGKGYSDLRHDRGNSRYISVEVRGIRKWLSDDNLTFAESATRLSEYEKNAIALEVAIEHALSAQGIHIDVRCMNGRVRATLLPQS